MALIDLNAKLEGSADAGALLGKTIQLEATLVGRAGSGLGQRQPPKSVVPKSEPDFSKE